MKTSNPMVLKCWRFTVFFYVIFNCISGLTLAVFAGFLLVFHYEASVLKPRLLAINFLVVPLLLAALTTFVGWTSVRGKKFKMIKTFAVLLAVTAILEISGALWCFASFKGLQDQIQVQMQEKFTAVKKSGNEYWWNNIQRELKCCGLHGPTDYHSINAVPFSCCGSDPNDNSKGSCSFMWQKGCANALYKEISHDLILLSIISLSTAFLQIPGVFISWGYANRISRISKVKSEVTQVKRKREERNKSIVRNQTAN